MLLMLQGHVPVLQSDQRVIPVGGVGSAVAAVGGRLRGALA
jgi:hypothetical protein